MTKTNVILATMDSVKTLEGMVLQPVKILEELGYGYKEEDACEGTGWTEYRYTGVNPDNPDDIAVVTVGERDDEQYVTWKMKMARTGGLKSTRGITLLLMCTKSTLQRRRWKNCRRW